MSQTTHILVVDDDRALGELLRRILQKEGFDVSVASTAEEGIQLCRGHRFDLALVDVMLPGMDGYSLCRHLRQNVATHHLPILMLTAKGDIADKIAGFEAGADDYLTKPFQPKELVYRVRSLMARSRISSPAASELPTQERGFTIALLGSKGGVGKTTISVNLAVALRQQTAKRVALFDADFVFGDVGVHLNLPTVRTILNATDDTGAVDGERVEQATITHASGVRVLLSPFRPEEGDRITVAQVEQILEGLRARNDFVVVDCQPSYDERLLKLLALADMVLLIVTPEVGPLKNSSLFLDLAAKLGHSLDKIAIVLNRYNSNVGIGPEEIERTLQHEVTFRIISGGRPVVLSVNRGIPLLIEQPDHPFSVQVRQMAEHCVERAVAAPLLPVSQSRLVE